VGEEIEGAVKGGVVGLFGGGGGVLARQLILHIYKDRFY